MSVKVPIKTRVASAFRGFITTFINPAYILLALTTSFIITGFIIWSLNFDLLQFIWFEFPIPFSDRIQLMWDVHTGIYTAYSNVQATGIILFGFLFGINTSLIVKLLRNSNFRSIPKKSGGASLFFALVSGGCVACGTSILAPLLATLGATSTAFISDLSNILNWISIVLIGYSIYKLSGVINNTAATKIT